MAYVRYLIMLTSYVHYFFTCVIDVLAEDFAPPKPKTKKKLPPQPAMFRLHAPISVPTAEEGTVGAGGSDGKDQPDAKPSAKPSTESTKEGATTASMDKKRYAFSSFLIFFLYGI